MLYQPEAFEPLTDQSWDEDRVRDAIREIVADTEGALRGPRLLWRADDWDGWHGTSPMKNLYAGAAGVPVAPNPAASARTPNERPTGPGTNGSAARTPSRTRGSGRVSASTGRTYQRRPATIAA